MAFIATVTYECDASTAKDAAKLFRAEMCGRRWFDLWEGRPMPSTMLWTRKVPESAETVDEVKAKCEADIRSALEAVAKIGKPVTLSRVWLQVTGAGIFGLADF